MPTDSNCITTLHLWRYISVLTCKPPALEGLGDDGGRLALDGARLVERLRQRLHVVPVHDVRVPPAASSDARQHERASSFAASFVGHK